MFCPYRYSVVLAHMCKDSNKFREFCEALGDANAFGLIGIQDIEMQRILELILCNEKACGRYNECRNITESHKED